jgi:hypothetical protein
MGQEVIKIYIIGRCAHQIDGDENKICNHEPHIHLKPNRTYVKKIRNRCVHIGKVDGGRVKDLENINFEIKKKKRGDN